jgi:hypothetical protein
MFVVGEETVRTRSGVPDSFWPFDVASLGSRDMNIALLAEGGRTPPRFYNYCPS